MAGSYACTCPSRAKGAVAGVAWYQVALEYVNWSAPVLGLVPALPVTVTSTVPAASGGELVVIEVDEVTV